MPRCRLSQLILAGMGLVGLALLLSQIHAYGGSLPMAPSLIYYGAPATLSLISVLGIFMPRDARTCVIISGISVATALLGADLYFAFIQKPERSTRHQQLVDKWIEEGIPHDDRTQLQVVEDRRQSGEEIYPKLNPATLLKLDDQSKVVSRLKIGGNDLLPLGTISRMKSVYCNEGGQFLIYKSDRHGFHNPDNVWDSKKITIAAVGDSFTEGACIPSERNFMSLIRNKYPATLNLAMGGNGSLFELATLTEYLVPTRPRIVLWVYFEGNDLKDMATNKGSAQIMRYLQTGYSQNLINRQSEIDGAIRSYFDERIKKHKSKPVKQPVNLIDVIFLRNVRERLASRLLPRFPSLDKEKENENLRLLGTVISTAQERVNRWGGTVVLVYLPSRSSHHDGSARRGKLQHRRQVLEIFETSGMPVINVAAAFDKLEDPPSLYMFRVLGHYTEHGNEIVSGIILKALDRLMSGRNGGPL